MAAQEPELKCWVHAHGDGGFWFRDTFTGKSMERPGERQNDDHFVLIMDQAAWHASRDLKLPEAIRSVCRCDYIAERAG